MESSEILIVGNYKSSFLIYQLQEQLSFKDLELFNENKRLKVLVCPSFIHIPMCKALVRPPWLNLCGQNCSPYGEGPYTGEVTANQLKELGVDWVIIGHSERRHLGSESNELIMNKVKCALESGLEIILCIGENSDERSSGFTADVIEKQIKDVVYFLGDWSKVVIAYEPVWSFGTVTTVRPEQVIEVKALIFRLLEKLVNPGISSQIRFIYGAMPSNPLEFLEKGQLNGYLFSVDPESSGFVQTLLNFLPNTESKADFSL